MKIARPVALASRAFAETTALARAAEQVRALGLDRLVLDLPGPVEPGARADLAERGVTVAAVALHDAGLGRGPDAAFEAALGRAVEAASRAKAARVIVRGARAFDAHRGTRERAIDDAARRFHPLLRDGVPLAVRPGSRPDDLLLADETEWLLEALPRLVLALDPWAARRLEKAGAGPAPAAWAERFARRVALVLAHGPGEEGHEGGGHPGAAGVDWHQVAELVPAGATWVLALEAGAGAPVRDCLGYLRSRIET